MSKTMQAPKLILSGQGESFPMLGLTFTAKITADDTNNGWVMHEITGTEGHGAPLHTHPWEETFYVLEGEMEVHIGRRQSFVTAGTLMHLPANVAHDFRVCSPTIRLLEMIPAFAQSFYQEVGEKITSMPPDLELFETICRKHGVRLL
jgi:quercetin dioxygenase-like cupin family protein